MALLVEEEWYLSWVDDGLPLEAPLSAWGAMVYEVGGGLGECRGRDIQMPSKELGMEAQSSRDANGIVLGGGCVLKEGRGADDEERNVEHGMRGKGKASRDTKTVMWVASKRALAI